MPINQIDSYNGQLWAVQSDNRTHFLSEIGNWASIDDEYLTHVTVGKSGVWGVNKNGSIFYRTGVSLNVSYGTSWQKTFGELKQIDAGSSGVVYGVNR